MTPMAAGKRGEQHRGREAQAMKKIGRPRIIESPAEMDRLVEEYVTKCHEEEEPLTLTGMILHLGLSSRRVFDDYQDRPEFTHSVKRAKLLIENGYEVDLRRTGNPAGSIFALKNMGWSDRREVEFRGSLASIDLTQLSDEHLARIAAGENPYAVLVNALERGLSRDALLGLPAASEEDRAEDGDAPHRQGE